MFFLLFAARLLAMKIGIFFASIALLTLTLEATTTSAVFAKYPNRYFIETGTYFGDGIASALEAGFPFVYSIELGEDLYTRCCARFAETPNVKLFLGDSAALLPSLLETIDAPATFWLDGHFSNGYTAKGPTNTPLLTELEHIARHPIKTHTLLIDDVRALGTPDFDDITLEMVLEKIRLINPEYQITYEDGYCPNDVLVATIPE